MNIKNYDSGFCGSLPLHQINHIQSYGYLVITNEELEIVQVSENIGELLGTAPAELVGKGFLACLDSRSAAELKEKIAGARTQKLSVRLQLNAGDSGNLLAVISRGNGCIIMELEKKQGAPESFYEVYQHIRSATDLIGNLATSKEVLETAALELKRISGFDKVMIYRFDEQWNGNVVAEAMEEGMESYLGLYFPASDIPKQAREMYRKNAYRLIPDRDYQPVKLYPLINPLLSGFADLSGCNMRGVARVHIEYLANMKVSCSMSTRIIKDNKLWGIISCHHRKPLFLNYDECLVFELLSGIVSSRLSSLETKEASESIEATQPVISEIAEDIYASGSLKDGLVKSFPRLQKALNLGGVAFTSNNRIYTAGNCPATEDIEEMVNWLQARQLKSSYHTTSLAGELDGAGLYADKASGLLAIPVISDNREFVLGFRPEAPQSISWGGNPDEAIRFESDGTNYHPRNSFQLWKQAIQDTSFAFTPTELGFAGQIHRVVLNYRLQELNRQ